MASPLIKLQNLASESQKNIVLVICILAMSVMCIGLVWQAPISAKTLSGCKISSSEVSRHQVSSSRRTRLPFGHLRNFSSATFRAICGSISSQS
jgi:hypothetical protein